MVSLIFYLLYLVSLLLRRERRGFSGTEDISHSYIYGWGGYLYQGRNWAAEILAIAKGIQMIEEQTNWQSKSSFSLGRWTFRFRVRSSGSSYHGQVLKRASAFLWNKEGDDSLVYFINTKKLIIVSNKEKDWWMKRGVCIYDGTMTERLFSCKC